MVTASKQVDQEHFKYRVSAVLLRNGKVLVHRAEMDDFWALPGGHVEMMESSKGSLRREMKEELGIDVEIKRLLWVAENFFEDRGYRFHEVCFYYLIDITENSEILETDGPFYGEEDEYEFLGDRIKLIFRWYPIDELEDLRLYPSFLLEGLKDIPESTEHIVHEDFEDDGSSS